MLPRLLIDEPFRVQLVEHHVGDPVVRSFWLNEYAGYGDHFRAEAISPIQNKIGKALIEPRLRNMLAQPSSTITLRRLMDEGAIVICNLSKGRLGESVAHLLGALLTTAIAQAALSRADMPAAERRVFHLYADEFQSFATESFALILSRGAQVRPDADRSATSISTSSPSGCVPPCSAMSARSSPAAPAPQDAPILAEQIGLGGADALLDLPNFAAWARLLSDGVPTSPMRLDLFAAPPPRRPARRTGSIDDSRRRFGRPRAEVEARIRRFLAA